jgi:glycosyltransferase involved in cell wall biosynthesis
MGHHPPVSSRIRVLLLSNAIAPDRPGGLERYVRDLAGALSRAGADVMVHARRVNPQDPARCIDGDGVDVRRFDTPSRDNLLYALGYPAATARAVRTVVAAQSRTRVLHSHYPLQGLPLALGRTPYVHTFHAPVHRELIPEHQGAYALPSATRAAAARLMRLGESRVVRRAQSVTVLSEFMEAQALALGADPQSITVMPGGIDTKRFSPGPPASHEWAHAGGPLLFTARRLVPRTGVGELVEAFARISDRVEDARLVIAGRGPLEDDIRARVRAHGLQERVLMLGWISDEELVDWYRAASLVMMPTQELEGFGLTTAEALACGTPVVGTPAGANPEVLARLDASLTTRDVSAAAMAETVIELLADSERLAALSARARAAVHPALSWDLLADGYMALYERHRFHSGGAGRVSVAGGPTHESEIVRSTTGSAGS